MKKPLTRENLYDMRSLSQPVIAWGQTFATQNQTSHAFNTYQPQLIELDSDYSFVRDVNDALFASMCAQPARDVLFYLGQATPESAFTLYMGDKNLNHNQVSTLPVQTLVAGRQTNKAYFKVLQTSENPLTPDAEKPNIRHITSERYAADGFGFIPNDASYDLYEYDADNQTQRKIFSSKRDFKLCDVSIDGTKIALSMTNNPSDETDYSTGISILDPQSGTIRSLTESHQDWLFNQATFSPDGRKLLMNVQTTLTMALTDEKVFEYTFSTGELTPISTDIDEDLHDVFLSDNVINMSGRAFSWYDNDQFYFRTNVHGHSKFYFSDGKHTQTIFESDLHVTDWATNADGDVVACYTTGEKPAELATITRDGQKKDCFNVNQSFEVKYEIAPQKKFNYLASDGLRLDGWLIKPLHPKAGKIPLFLYIHGGPHDAWGDSFYLEMQILAASGYGVLLLNPRGSASYGLDFMKADQGAYGEQDYTDLLEGMDFILKKHPEFDANRQYVGGCSFGGFMSAWMVGHTDRFKGAIVQNPVTDFISMVGVSDEGIPFIEEDLLTETTDINRLWHFSPLAYADKVSTPTLIIGSEWDKRCPIEQSEEYYSALKHRHVDTELTRFPQSWHTIMYWGKPNLRIEWMSETQRWMDEH